MEAKAPHTVDTRAKKERFVAFFNWAFSATFFEERLDATPKWCSLKSLTKLWRCGWYLVSIVKASLPGPHLLAGAHRSDLDEGALSNGLFLGFWGRSSANPLRIARSSDSSRPPRAGLALRNPSFEATFADARRRSGGDRASVA